jgi:predicted AlkP superfamily pyrophosphatase or phosphodiesterase
MEKTEISIINDGNKEIATLRYDAAKIVIIFSMEDGFRKKYESEDLYLCLAKIRDEFPHVKFLCKGAKLNVTPSRMCSQMSGGSVAYELTMGKSATFDDIVHIFDYEEENIAKNLQEQREFYKNWLQSLKQE